jgi:hypothetical protein
MEARAAARRQLYGFFMSVAPVSNRKLIGSSLSNSCTLCWVRIWTAAMALINLAATRVAVSWRRTMLEGVGTFFVLAGIAVGILTLRLALVLIHGVMH